MDDKQEHPSQGSRLLRLPVEVRLIILSHIFGWRVTPYHPTLEDTPEKHLHTQTRALRWSAESSMMNEKLLYSKVSFSFSTWAHLRKFFSSKAHEPHYDIQLLTLRFDDADTLLSFLDAPIGHHAGKKDHEWAVENFIGSFAEVKAKLKKLRSVHVHLPGARGPVGRWRGWQQWFQCRETPDGWMRQWLQKESILAAAQAFLVRVPDVGFLGYISEDQHKEFRVALAARDDGGELS